jgi:hypothetical protein
MAKTETFDYISEDLRSLAYPIDQLELLPGNPRKGNVDAVAKSLEVFGQRKPVVARRKEGSDMGIVLAGNTTLQGGRRLGWSHIAVTWVDDDDKTAAAFAIADNRTHDLGEYDDEAIIDMVQQFDSDFDLLDASGYDLIEIEDLVQKIAGEDETDFSQIFDDEESSEDTPERTPPRPVIQYAIVFDNEEQQQRWFAFIRWLKSEFSDLDTVAERLDAYISGVIEE